MAGNKLTGFSGGGPGGITVLNQPDVGSRIGSALGTGLGQGLQSLLESKMSQMQQRNIQDKLSKILGPEQAQQYAPFAQDPVIMRELIKSKLAEPMKTAQGEFLTTQGIPKEVLNLPPQVQAAFIKQFGTASLENILGKIGTGEQDFQIKESLEQADTPQEVYKKVADITDNESLGYVMAPGAKAILETESLRNALKSDGLNPSEKAKLRSEIERREERFSTQQDKIDKRTDSYYDRVKEEYEGGREGVDRLDEQLRLIKEGNLPPAPVGAFMEFLEDKIGINLKGLLSGGAQEFDKLSKDFLRDAKKYFGARVTQGEINLFLKRIPTLVQSNDGKIRIINALKHFYDAGGVRNKIMDEIIEENKGYRPANLRDLVEKRAQPILADLAKKFKSGALRPEVRKALPDSIKLAEEYAFRHGPLGTLGRGIGTIGKYLGF